MTIVVAVATHADGECYVVRAEASPGEPVVVWRVAQGLCEGREFVAAPVSGGDAAGDLQRALGPYWHVRLAGEVCPYPVKIQQLTK